MAEHDEIVEFESDDEGDSLDFIMYQHLLHHPHASCVLPTSLEKDLERLQPERFDLKKLGDIFSAWHTSFENKGKQLGRPWFPVASDVKHLEGKDYLEYEYDKLTWHADDWIQRRRDNGLVLNIKLVNDGFIYKHWKRMNVVDGRLISQHQCGGWVVLQLSSYLSVFQDMISFAEWWTGSNVKILILYNYSHDRLDFKAFDDLNNRQVTITFERGYPVTDLFDYWKAVPTHTNVEDPQLE